MKRFDNTPLDYDKAKNKALKMLEMRDHTELEIRQKLKLKGAENDVIDDVISFLNDYKLIDDRKFAILYSKDLQNLKRLGKKRIKVELSKKGISNAVIDEVLLDLPDDNNEILSELVKKKLRGNFEKKSTDKAIRYFITKGYSLTDIKNAIEKVTVEENGI